MRGIFQHILSAFLVLLARCCLFVNETVATFTALQLTPLFQRDEREWKVEGRITLGS